MEIYKTKVMAVVGSRRWRVARRRLRSRGQGAIGCRQPIAPVAAINAPFRRRPVFFFVFFSKAFKTRVRPPPPLLLFPVPHAINEYVGGTTVADQRRGGGDLQQRRSHGQHNLRCSRGRAHGGRDEHHRARHRLPDAGEKGFCTATMEDTPSIYSLAFSCVVVLP